MTTLEQDFVSVIIPVYNDSRRLMLCLQALSDQTYPKHRYEIVIVDNGSTEDIQCALHPFSQQVVFACEKKAGSYAARNKGITIAKGDILAFTDSDCIPSSDWLEQGAEALLAEPSIGIAAGRVEFFFQCPNHPSALELFDSTELLQQEEYVKQQWGATANLFTTPTVFAKVGLFNAKLKSGGDLEWGKRVSAHGYKVVYVPNGLVSHPARSSLADMQKKMLRRLGGMYALARLSHSNGDVVRSLLNQKLLLKLRPPIRSAIRKSFLNKKISHYHHKAMIFSIVFMLHYLEFFELCRLRMGGQPARQ